MLDTKFNTPRTTESLTRADRQNHSGTEPEVKLLFPALYPKEHPEFANWDNYLSEGVWIFLLVNNIQDKAGCNVKIKSVFLSHHFYFQVGKRVSPSKEHYYNPWSIFEASMLHFNPVLVFNCCIAPTTNTRRHGFMITQLPGLQSLDPA